MRGQKGQQGVKEKGEEVQRTQRPQTRDKTCLPLNRGLVMFQDSHPSPTKRSPAAPGRGGSDVPTPRGLREEVERDRGVLTQEDGDDEPQRLFRRAEGRRQLVKAQLLETPPQHLRQLRHRPQVPLSFGRHLSSGRPPGTPQLRAPRMWAQRCGFTPNSGRETAHRVRIGCGPAQCLQAPPTIGWSGQRAGPNAAR